MIYTEIYVYLNYPNIILHYMQIYAYFTTQESFTFLLLNYSHCLKQLVYLLNASD